MAEHRAIARAAERPRLGKLVTTIIMLLMTVLIVRDILVRRWTAPASASDLTRKLR